MAFHWTCPFCNRDTVVTNGCQTDSTDLTFPNAEGARRLSSVFIVCPNPKCRKFTLSVALNDLSVTRNALGNVQKDEGKVLQTWSLIPQSEAKVFPEYVPKPIRDDYEEACAIKNLSAKASATLARRCLQGMIRDFWGVSRGRLVDEIDAIKDKVDSLTWQAIDAVRKVGNIGAHMEADINIIVDVDPGEAQQLIGLIELLIKDWYVLRQDRQQRLKSVAEIGAAKSAEKKSGSV